MAIQPRQLLVSSSKYNIKCPYTMNAEYITFHNTANDASAENEVKYMISNNNQVSYHFAVDDKEVVQGLPLDRNAWHCGDGGNGTGNRKSIGVEVCYSKSGGERYKQAEALAIKFIAQLLYERGWGIDRVKKHQDWNGKYCPHRVLSEGRWQTVLNEIQSELNKLKQPINQYVQKPTPETESKGVDDKVFNPNSSTLKQATEYVLYRMELEGDLTNKWRFKLHDGTLTESEAIGLLFTAIERGFIFNKYSNR